MHFLTWILTTSTWQPGQTRAQKYRGKIKALSVSLWIGQPLKKTKKTACSLKGGFCFQERKKKIRRTQICHSLSAHSHTDTHTEEQPSSVLISEELHYCGCARHNWEWVVVHKHSSTRRMRNLLWLIQVVLRPVVCVLVRWTTTRCLLLSSTERAPTAGPDRLWMLHCDATEPCNWKVGQHPPLSHTHTPYILTSWTRKYPPPAARVEQHHFLTGHTDTSFSVLTFKPRLCH